MVFYKKANVIKVSSTVFFGYSSIFKHVNVQKLFLIIFLQSIDFVMVIIDLLKWKHYLESIKPVYLYLGRAAT
ncbi:hypothetical protein BH09BAC1_BH09BAC1_07640 [soil metagenome]